MAMVTSKNACDMCVQAAICACKQLRTLVFRPLVNIMTPDEIGLSEMFMASLPELRVLQFQTAR